MFWNWTVGRRVNPANMNGIKTAYKTLDETVTNSATLQDDDDLLFSVGSNETWGFQFNLLYSGTTGGDFRVALTFPSGASCPWGKIGLNSSLAVDMVGFDAPVSGASVFQLGGNGATNTMTAILFGTCFNGSTAGSVRLQFAQGTAVAAEIARMRKGSNLIAVRFD